MGELLTGPMHTLSDTDPESNVDLHAVPPGYQPKGEGDCGYMAQYNQDYSGLVGLVSLGRLPKLDMGAPILNPHTGMDHQPWLATQQGEGSSDMKPIVRGSR